MWNRSTSILGIYNLSSTCILLWFNYTSPDRRESWFSCTTCWVCKGNWVISIWCVATRNSRKSRLESSNYFHQCLAIVLLWWWRSVILQVSCSLKLYSQEKHYFNCCCQQHNIISYCYPLGTNSHFVYTTWYASVILFARFWQPRVHM